MIIVLVMYRENGVCNGKVGGICVIFVLVHLIGYLDVAHGIAKMLQPLAL
jgi:hypothetical protein